VQQHRPALRWPAKDIGAAEGGSRNPVRVGKLTVAPEERPVYGLSGLVAGIADKSLYAEKSTACTVDNEF